MNVGTLTIFLGVTTSGINKAIRDANRFERSVVTSAQSAQAAMLSFGRVATQFLTFPLSIIGGVATKTFSDFEYNLAKVTGLVGIASDQTKEWGEELKDLAGAVGKSPQELSEALYFVTTGGIRGAETMDVLTVAAKAAAAGLGETQQVTDLLVSAMNAYGKENLSAARAADILVASVKEGKAEAPALAQSMGIVLPIASKLGVSFDQVGAAMAAMTRTGTKASTAAMQTRQILNKIVKPANQSKEAIKGVGTSFEELRHIIGTQGLLPALIKLNDLTKEYGIDTMANIFPNIRALAGVLDILGENLDENIKSQEAITNSAGALDHAFATVAKTWKFQLNQAIREGQTLMVELGEAIARTLTPNIKGVFDSLSRLADNFNNLTSEQQGSIIKIGLLAAALGPLIILFNILRSSIIAPLISLYFSLEKSMGAVLDKTALGVHQLGKYVYKVRENIVVQKQQTVATRAQTVAAQQQNVATETLIASTTALSTIEKTYSGTVSYVTQSENGSIATKKALIFVIRETFAALTEGITTSNAYAISLTRIAQALDYNIARFQYLANQYVLLTTSVNLNSKALDYNVARYVRIQTALNILNAEIQRGVQVIAMHTVTLSNHQKALGYDTARYAALIAIIQKHTGVLGLNIAALDQQMVNFQLLTNQKMIDTSVTEIVIFKNSQLATSFTAISTQVALLKYELALLNKTYTLFSSQLMMGAAPAVKQLAARQTQLALGMGTVLKTHISWKAFQLDFIAKMKAMGAAILQFTKYLGLMAARFLMTAGYAAIFAIIGAAIYGWIKQMREAKKDQEELNNTVNEGIRIYAKEAQVLNRLSGTAQSEYTTKEMREQAIIRLNNLAPVYLRNLSEENIRTKEGTKLIDEYREALERKAQAQAASNALIELEQKRIEEVASGTNKTLTFWERAAKGGVVYAATGTSHILPFINAHKNALRELQWQQEKEIETEERYLKMRNAYIQIINSSKYALSDFTKQYDYLSEKVKEAEKNDRAFGKTVLNDINTQIRAMDEYLSMLQESWGIAIKGNDFEEALKLEGKAEEARALYTQLTALKTIMEALLPTLFDYEEYAASPVGKLDELFTKLNEDLKSVERANILFGDSYDILTEKLRVYEGVLKEASTIEGSVNDARLKAAKSEWELLKLINQTRDSYNDKLGEAADAALELNEIYENQYGFQNKVADAIERANSALAIMSLYEEMPWLVQPQDLVGVEGFRDIMKELEKLGLQFLPIYERINELVKGFEVGQEMQDFQMSMKDIDERISLIGNNSELLNAKLSLLKKQFRDLLKAPIEDTATYIQQLKDQAREIANVEWVIESMNLTVTALTDVFTGLGEAIGKSMAGAEDAVQGLIEVFMSVFKKIGTTLISIGALLTVSGILSGLGVKLMLIGTGIVALTSFVTSSMQQSKKAANGRNELRATGMAQGGVVPPGYPNDSYPAMLTSGETVIPPKKLPKFEDRDIRVHVLMEGKVKGRDLYYIMKEEERVIGNSF